MKKKILGITALLAVLAMVLAFTACDGLLGDKDDGEERTVTFINNSQAEIEITCQGTPNSFTLEAAANRGDDSKKQLVTRKGKDIILTTIVVTKPAGIPQGDQWKYIEVTGSAVPGNSKGKDGLALKSGTIKFSGVKGNDFLEYKIDTIDE
jgi:lipopolysaccharide export LptBFGC system permease protein LptF